MGIFHLEEPPEAWQREERPGQETDTWAHGRGCSLGTRLHPRLAARTVLQGERTLWPLGPHHLDGPKARTSGQAHKQLQALMHPLRVPFPKQASPSPCVDASFPSFPRLSGGQPPVHEAIFQDEKLPKSHSLQLTPRQNWPFPTPHCTLTTPSRLRATETGQCHRQSLGY